MSKSSELIPEQRRDRLMRALRRDQVLSIAQLTKLLDVCHMTVRRDIAVLEREGRAHAVVGGVRLAEVRAREPTFDAKAHTDRPQKRAIAADAAALIADGMAVYLDAGTTTGALVDHMGERTDLTLVTNDFAIVAELCSLPQLRVIHTGGQLDHPNRSAIGQLAADTLRGVNLDIAFISTSSWDLARGVTTPSEAKVAVKRAAIRAASRAILVAASSKFGTFGVYAVAGLNQFDCVITDQGLPKAAAKGIRDHGVSLRLAVPVVEDLA